jgi:serine/threonine protein kinase
MTSNNSDLTGRVLGTCTLEKLIGRGGMGVVYLAQQVRPVRRVAVKVLLPNTLTSSEVYKQFLARFQREANLIAQLEHINIMPIYEYGEQDGLAFLVMPYLTGGSLRDLLTRRGALSFPETMNYLEQAASALDYAHAHSVIHRDLKPANFLLHADGRLVLADFGIARIMQDSSSTIGSTLTGTGMFLGTPDYMAPEMARGEYIDRRADIYELGIVLYQMLSGDVPFKGDTPLVVAVKHMQEPLPSLHQVNPTIPLAVDAVVQQATAKRREDRFFSVLEFAQAFRAAITSPYYPPASNAWNAPSLSPSQQIVSPQVLPGYETPQGQDVKNQMPEPLVSERSRRDALATEAKTPSPNYAAAPHETRDDTPKSGARLWLMLIGLFLVLTFVVGGILIARGAFATPQSTGGITPTSLTQHTSTPTPTFTPTPTQQARAAAMVQQYYDDINIRDYQDAYNLLGSQLQSNQPYNTFVSGYAQTEHDNIAIGTVSGLPDGTFKVPITIMATQDNVPGPGTHQSTYTGYYIVGLENGTLKILNASIT